MLMAEGVYGHSVLSAFSINLKLFKKILPIKRKKKEKCRSIEQHRNRNSRVGAV